MDAPPNQIIMENPKNNNLVNPLSPNIHTQILQTDLYTFPLRIS